MNSAQPATLDLKHYGSEHMNADFCAALLDSLAEFGFVILRNHGIAATDFARAYALAKSLFALPLEQKRQYETGSGQRGYIGFGKEKAAGQQVGDLKEYWHIGPDIPASVELDEAYPENVWPQEIPEFKTFFKQLHEQLNQVAQTLCLALAEALGVERHYFKEIIAHGNSVQRLIHYPPLRDLDQQGAVRAAAHADINLMTLLIGATDSGLQLLNKSGTWIEVEHKADEIVVDTGDMMARLTNHYLPATIHRVVNPPGLDSARFSIPYFVHPRNSVILECLPRFRERSLDETAISAGEFLQQRLRENGF